MTDQPDQPWTTDPPKVSWTTASCSASAPVTVESIRQLMADFERQWPKQNLCQRIGVDPLMMSALSRCKDPLDAPAFGRGLYGVPVDVRMDIPWRSWIEEMADGSSVLHYEGGAMVRCLPASGPIQPPARQA